MDFDDRDFEAYRLSSGDILLNEGQSRELVGRCAVYDGAIPSCCFQNTLIRYRSGADVLPAYAFAYFQFCYHAGIFAAISSQTTSIAHLGADRFGRLLMPVPPIKQQEMIVSESSRIRDVELRLANYLAEVRRLEQGVINDVIS